MKDSHIISNNINYNIVIMLFLSISMLIIFLFIYFRLKELLGQNLRHHKTIATCHHIIDIFFPFIKTQTEK